MSEGFGDQLGYAYQCARRLEETKKSCWLRTALAATMLADQEMDPRDILLALAELSIVAEEAVIEPAPMLINMFIDQFWKVRRSQFKACGDASCYPITRKKGKNHG
jgi:hypothetical protein